MVVVAGSDLYCLDILQDELVQLRLALNAIMYDGTYIYIHGVLPHSGPFALHVYTV